jgi:hypothetical protein
MNIFWLSGFNADFIHAEISDYEIFMPFEIDYVVQKFNRLNLAVVPKIEFI